MESNAAVLAATCARLAGECEMARSVWGTKRPLADCLRRVQAVLGRLNHLLTSSFSPEIATGVVALNNLIAGRVRQAETARSPEAVDKPLAMLRDLGKLFRNFDMPGNSNGEESSARNSAELFRTHRNGRASGHALQASVVIPAYNSSATLWRAIESALAQELDGAHEVIVVDDCSIDETSEVLKLYEGRIRTVRMPVNRGVAAARNAGLAVAGALYVAFLDADDEFMSGRLARTIAALDAAPDAVLAYSDAALVDDVGLMIAPSLAPTVCNPATMREPSIDDLFSGCWWPILPSAVTVRKEVMARCG